MKGNDMKRLLLLASLLVSLVASLVTVPAVKADEEFVGPFPSWVIGTSYRHAQQMPIVNPVFIHLPCVLRCNTTRTRGIPNV